MAQKEHFECTSGSSFQGACSIKDCCSRALLPQLKLLCLLKLNFNLFSTLLLKCTRGSSEFLLLLCISVLNRFFSFLASSQLYQKSLFIIGGDQSPPSSSSNQSNSYFTAKVLQVLLEKILFITSRPRVHSKTNV
uniref:Uncharacterized protein n=1 Tax=Kalanchoe fedtschenkoi TaxID=63787 RepID=A0A7N0TF61_KALFE